MFSTQDNEAEKCWNSALYYISRKERSTLEVKKYLTERRGYPTPLVESTVERLVENRWINDQRLAEILTRAEWRKGKGTRVIQQKLKLKGLVLTETEMNALLSEDQGVEPIKLAKDWVTRKYPNFLKDPRERQKAFQGLVRRGFSFDVAKRATSRPSREELEAAEEDSQL